MPSKARDIEEYRRKRDFANTPEPAPSAKKAAKTASKTVSKAPDKADRSASSDTKGAHKASKTGDKIAAKTATKTAAKTAAKSVGKTGAKLADKPVKPASRTASKSPSKKGARDADSSKQAEKAKLEAAIEELPIFVIQKHDASRLHYDFRLEVDGVLASWAVPKGPTMQTGIRRLAVHVEDHPYDYKDFEGNIPEGNYGAGSVIVWDRGTYRNLMAEKPAAKGRMDMAKAIRSGMVEIWLYGEKLKGGFVLVRTDKAEDQWLLMKMDDKTARHSGDVTASKPRSVISGRTVEEVAHGDKPHTAGAVGEGSGTAAKAKAAVKVSGKDKHSGAEGKLSSNKGSKSTGKSAAAGSAKS